jgi:hypothetical protein
MQYRVATGVGKMAAFLLLVGFRSLFSFICARII